MLIESSQLLQWESHYRAAFVNSLSGFDAPYVKESRISTGLILHEHRELTINKTHMIVGEVLWAER